MYFKRCEMDLAFDRFILSMAKRSAPYSDFFHIQSGEKKCSELRNYVLAVHQNTQQQTELSIVEYRITIHDRRPALEMDRIQQLLGQDLFEKFGQPLRVKRYLILGNKSGEVAEADLEIIAIDDLQPEDLGSHHSKLLNTLQAARLDPNFGASNIYEFNLMIGNSSRSVRELLLTPIEEPPVKLHHEPYYRLDPEVKNAICLMELYDDLRADPSLNLGLFLIREAINGSLITHINPVRKLSDVTPSTHFIASDEIRYEDVIELNPTVHEVVFREDYGLVYWKRSSVPTWKLLRYLSSAAPDNYERCFPLASWLNVIHAERTAGKSRFLKFLEGTFRREMPFGMVRLVDGGRGGILDNGELSVDQKLGKIFGLETEQEREVLRILAKCPDRVLLLIDHVDHVGELVVKFLKEIDKGFQGGVKVWLAARDKLRELVEDQFAIVSQEIPKLDKIEQSECLKLMLPKVDFREIEEILTKARSANIHQVIWEELVEYPFTTNVFHLKLIADGYLKGSKDYYEVNLLEDFVKSNLYQEDDQLDQECYRMVVEHHHNSAVARICEHATVVEYLAARYLTTRPELITLDIYRSFISLGTMVDRMLVKGSDLATAVLNRDVEQVLGHLESCEVTQDVLQRNALHLCQQSVPIAEALINAGVNLEQTCLLSNYTPLQMADFREDWRFVDLLLKNGTKADFPGLQLHTMTSTKLETVFDDCFTYKLYDLFDWILNNRRDFQMTQKLIYDLIVIEEFDRNRAFRVLELAHEQGVHHREPIYRFMWGNTALHQAAYSNRLDLCRFLVDKLEFNVDLEDYSGTKALGECSNVSVVEFLKSRSKAKESANEASDDGEQQDEDKDDEPESLFFNACYPGNLEIVKYAVEHDGHDPLKSEKGSNGFIQAAAAGSLPIVEYLYEKGFRDLLDVEDDTGYTALATAIHFEHLPVVQFLVEKGASSEKILDNPKNPELVKFLVEHCNFKPAVNFEALAELTVDELRALDFDFSTEDENGQVFLHFYVEYHENPDVLRFLLTKYEDVDLECKDSTRTALHTALMVNHQEMVDILLDAGADVHKRCRQTDQSVLHFAAGSNDKCHLELFLTKYGLSVDDRDGQGRSIVFFLGRSSPDIFRLMATKYGMDINARDNSGQTILHKTVINEGYFYLVELEFLLRDVGVRPDIADEQGRLALYYAAEKGQHKAIRVLGRYGRLEIHLRDPNGKSPLELAEDAGFNEIVEYFRSL